MRKFITGAALVCVLLVAGCKGPSDNLPAPNPNSDRIVTFTFDIYDEGFNDVVRPASYIVTATDGSGNATTFTSEGVTQTGTWIDSTTVPFALPLVLDISTVEVTVQVTVTWAEKGDEMHCWVERPGEMLITTERTFAAAIDGPLFGSCSYTVGMPAV